MSEPTDAVTSEQREAGARRRVTDALHAMHMDHAILIDSDMAEELNAAWDAYDRTLLSAVRTERDAWKDVAGRTRTALVGAHYYLMDPAGRVAPASGVLEWGALADRLLSEVPFAVEKEAAERGARAERLAHWLQRCLDAIERKPGDGVTLADVPTIRALLAEVPS